jgi:hypothetical protein
MKDVVARLFGSPDARDEVPVFAAPILGRAEIRQDIDRRLAAGKSVVVYFQDKLGGEISIPSTDRSPELAFDITLAEIFLASGQRDIRRYEYWKSKPWTFTAPTGTPSAILKTHCACTETVFQRSFSRTNDGCAIVWKDRTSPMCSSGPFTRCFSSSG